MTELPLENNTNAPLISVIVIVYNMQREAPRTLISLTPHYQNVPADQYEVIVVENGSSQPLVREEVLNMSANFSYFYLDDASPSPAAALNFGVQESEGQMVGLMIDGARILSPGIISYVLRALRAYENPVVATLGWHIGPDLQHRAVQRVGYSQAVEDKLLDEINWQENGYRLFEVSAFAGSSSPGWFVPIMESNCVFAPRPLYDAIGGFDERFKLPGGGFVNLDFYKRICEHPDAQVILLLGEGTFHQIHGGTATSGFTKKLISSYFAQYKEIRGQDFVPPRTPPAYWGQIPPQSFDAIRQSVQSIFGVYTWDIRGNDGKLQLYNTWCGYQFKLNPWMKIMRHILQFKRRVVRFILGRDTIIP